jgi:alkanesulfonate monooxygenase SsuD/methylene tetrahydromethanopterin reductase-like flavin-dependent oxidoreductase (luciferase family)
MRKMRVKFGVFLGAAQGAPGETTNYDTIRKVTLKCEELNFDSCWLADHFVPRKVLPYQKSPIPSPDPFFECWTTLTALAIETKKIRLGTFVLCNSYRYPSLVAKMSATLDFISRGRLELGIGAGFFKEEYIMYGIPFPKLAVRIKQLEESIQIIKKMWTEEEASFNGKYYTIKKAFNNPKPIQRPHPPIWVGCRRNKQYYPKGLRC